MLPTLLSAADAKSIAASRGERRDDIEIEIGVRLKANAQARDSPNLALARWIFSQSTGSALFQGISAGLELAFGLFEVLVDLSLVI